MSTANDTPRRLRYPIVLLLLVLPACNGDGTEEPLKRRGPLGSLRDLVRFDRSQDKGGPFFLDRFEVTRGDYAEFAATPFGQAVGAVVPVLSQDEAVLPATRVDLRQARAFAHWRRCRLPRSDEWLFACTTDGRDTYPWGSRPDAARANTSDLGVFEVLPVGTFESGRNGDGPYNDLIGNVAEWTETVPGSWFYYRRHALSPMTMAMDRVARTPGLAHWAAAPYLTSPLLLVVAAGDRAPREVLGADFTTSMRDGPGRRAPGDYGDTLGIRLCTTPAELLRALAVDVTTLAGEDLRQLERFCRREGNRDVLLSQLPIVAMPADARARFAELLR